MYAHVNTTGHLRNICHSIFVLVLQVCGPSRLETQARSMAPSRMQRAPLCQMPLSRLKIRSADIAESLRLIAAGRYQFTNLPLNPYHLAVSVKGFAAHRVRMFVVRSFVPITVKTSLSVGAASTVIDVTGSDLVENDSTFHTDVDRGLFDKLPLESQSSSLSSLVTLSSPGVAADSNGLFHGLGRSRVELFFHRWPADYGSAEQGVLEPDSFELDSVD